MRPEKHVDTAPVLLSGIQI